MQFNDYNKFLHQIIYIILNNTDLVNKEKLFQMATYQSTRVHPFKLFKRRVRLNVRANSFSLRVIDNWNMLLASVSSNGTLYWVLQEPFE